MCYPNPTQGSIGLRNIIQTKCSMEDGKLRRVGTRCEHAPRTWDLLTTARALTYSCSAIETCSKSHTTRVQGFP